MSEPREPIDYDQRPTTFNGLLAASSGQARRQERYGKLPPDEGVTVTADAMLDMIQIIAELRARVTLLEEA